MGPSPSARLVARMLLVVLVVAVVLLAVVALVAPPAVERTLRSRVLPELSERLGRPVTVADVAVELLPYPHAELRGVEVAGPEGAPPALRAGRVEAWLRPWPLLRSRGQQVELRALSLEQAHLRLVRLPQGSWNWAELLERLRQPGSEREVLVEQFMLRDSRVDLVTQGGEAAEPTVALRALSAKAWDVAPGQPLRLEASTAVGSEEPNVQVELVVDPLPQSAEALEAGEWPQVSGTLHAEQVPVGALEELLPARLGAVVSGGRLQLEAQVSTEPERYVVRGLARVEALRLGGEPAQGRTRIEGSIPPGEWGKATVRLEQLSLEGPGVQLEGGATASLEPLRVRFNLRGPLLDLSTLLAAMPEEERGVGGAGGAGVGGENGPLLSERLRQRLQGADVSGTLEVERVRSGRLEASNLVAAATLQRGVLTLPRLRADVYGGRLVGDGTRVSLAEPVPEWRLNGRLEQVALGEAFERVTGRSPLVGSTTGQLRLEGQGQDWERVRENLTGRGEVELESAALQADLDTALRTAMARALRLTGQGEAVSELAPPGTTPLQRLHLVFQVEDGALELTRPVRLKTSFGEGELRGRVGLDQRLELQGTLAVPADFIAALSAGAFKPAGPVRVPLAIEGTLSEPRVRLQPEALARELVRGQTRGVLERGREELERMKERLRVPF